jgi:hypothetical protein
MRGALLRMQSASMNHRLTERAGGYTENKESRLIQKNEKYNNNNIIRLIIIFNYTSFIAKLEFPLFIWIKKGHQTHQRI